MGGKTIHTVVQTVQKSNRKIFVFKIYVVMIIQIEKHVHII